MTSDLHVTRTRIGRAVVLLALVGCARPTLVGVRGDEVVRHLDELGRTGSSHVATVRTDRVASDPEMVFLSQTVTFEDASTSLQRVVEGCGPFAGLRPCRLHATSLIVLRDLEVAARDREHDGEPIVQRERPAEESEHDRNDRLAASVTLGGLGGVGACLALCGEHRLGGTAVFGSITVIGAIAWAIVSGAHD